MSPGDAETRVKCGFVRDLLAGGELHFLQDFEAKELAQRLPCGPDVEAEGANGIEGLPELDLQKDLSDGAEGLRRAADLDVPVILSNGEGYGSREAT